MHFDQGEALSQVGLVFIFVLPIPVGQVLSGGGRCYERNIG